MALCWDLDDGIEMETNSPMQILYTLFQSSYQATLIFGRLLLFNIKAYYIISNLLRHVWDETVC